MRGSFLSMPTDRLYLGGDFGGAIFHLNNGGNQISVLLDAASWRVPAPEGLDKHPQIITQSTVLLFRVLFLIIAGFPHCRSRHILGLHVTVLGARTAKVELTVSKQKGWGWIHMVSSNKRGLCFYHHPAVLLDNDISYLYPGFFACPIGIIASKF